VSARRKATVVPIAEAQLQRTVLEMAGLFGWMRHHVYDSRLASGQWTDPGFLDLVLLKVYGDRPSRLLLVELKREDGRLTVQQEAWLAGLQDVPGVEVYIWRPSDLDEIERVLRR